MNLKSLIVVGFTSGLLVSTQNLNAAVHRGEEPDSFIQFVRPMGMGGAFTAVADDHNIFGYNPAGMVMRTGGQFTLFDLAAGTSEDTLDAIDFISDNESRINNLEDLSQADRTALLNQIETELQPLTPRVLASLAMVSYVSGPTFFGLPFHAGYGAFGNIDSQFRFNRSIDLNVVSNPTPSISYKINNDVVIPVSIAKRFEAPWVFPGNIGVGFTGKYILRKQVNQDRQNLLAIDDIEEPPIADGNGIGSDLGFLYQPSDRTNIGIMVTDFLGTKLSYDASEVKVGYQSTPARDTVIRPRTNVGIAVVPEKILFLLPTHDRWVFTLDVRDIFDKEDHLFFEDGLRKPFGEDLYTHLHAGTEFTWGMLQLRGGLNQGYATAGIGVNLFLFKLDYAYFGRELGIRAGDLRQTHHVASLSMKFGTGNVESRERIKKNKSMRKDQGSAPAEPLIEDETMEKPVEETKPMEEKTEEKKDEVEEKIEEVEDEIPE